MPTLQFKGKNIIWNHHMSVPYHTLEPVPELDYNADKANENLIVEGDNLIALKALLPQYTGKVDCIYIDPPYNTGNEHWTYNDNVNSPMIKEWLGKEVNSDDLTRHDKWLCMMTPRLKLLHELLKESGIIFISIDDNEQANLKLLCDEVFGEVNFIAQTVRASNSTKNNSNYLSITHDYAFVYAKSKENVRKNWQVDKRNVKDFQKIAKRMFKEKLPLSEIESELRALVKYPKYYDFDHYYYCDEKGVYRTDNAGGVDNGNQETEIYHPITKKACKKPAKGWRYNEETIKEMLDNNMFYFGEDENTIPLPKRYLNDYLTTIPSGISFFDTQIDTNLFKEIEIPFNFPKPYEYIKYLLQMEGSKDSIILDSFAGSGTTAHAVMALNEEDGGNRQCILVQMPENNEKEPNKNICKDITRERIVRSIEKYGYNSGFQYLRVGQALDAETLLSGKLPSYESFANYVYYLATGEHLEDESSIDAENYFVGSKGTRNIYLIYSNDMDTLQSLALNFEKAEMFHTHAGDNKITVYAPACFLDDEYLQEHKIEFVSIPYNLFNKTEEV